MSGEPLANGQQEIYTLNVGQADAHTIITEDGTLNLIDADEEAVGDELDTVLDGRTTPKTETGNIPIETFVVTHFHDDHTGGVEELYDHGYEIQHVIEPDAHRYELRDLETGEPEKGVSPLVLETYERELEKHDPESVRQVSEGDSVSPDMDNQVLAPPSESGEISVTSPVTKRKNTLKPIGANANSLAFKTEGDQSALFMGDVEDTGGLNGETWLMHQHDTEQSDVTLDANALILAHHGSNNATSKEFLERVDPELAVISSDLGEEYDHPTDEVLKNLHETEVDVHWTAGHGTLHTDLDAETARPEPTTDLGTTDAADLAALKYYCREQDVSPEQLEALTSDHLPDETPEWVADSAPMLVETNEEIVDAAITNAETVEEVRHTLDATPDAHEQLQETVQADREEHVTTKADVKRNREAYFNAKQKEDAYKQLPLHTRVRANLPSRYGGIEHPLDDVPTSEEIDGPRKVEAVPKAVRNPPAAQLRANDELTKATARYTRGAEDAADEAVDTAATSERLCHHLRQTDGAHQDFLYAIETPNAHTANTPEKGISELLERSNENQAERTNAHTKTRDQDMSLGL